MESNGNTLSKFFKAVAAIPQKISDIQTAVNGLADEVKAVRRELEDHVAEDQWSEMKQRRVRILRFADEIRDGKSPSEEHWDDIIEDIDHYEEYCESHPEYHNNKGQANMRFLKSKYFDLIGDEKNDMV